MPCLRTFTRQGMQFAGVGCGATAATAAAAAVAASTTPPLCSSAPQLLCPSAIRLTLDSNSLLLLVQYAQQSASPNSTARFLAWIDPYRREPSLLY